MGGSSTNNVGRSVSDIMNSNSPTKPGDEHGPGGKLSTFADPDMRGWTGGDAMQYEFRGHLTN